MFIENFNFNYMTVDINNFKVTSNDSKKFNNKNLNIIKNIN